MLIEVLKKEDGFWLSLDGDKKALIHLGEHSEIVTSALEEAFESNADNNALRDELAHKSYAAGQALTEISELLGESAWDYPLQVYRMVVKLRNERDELMKQTQKGLRS